MDVKKIKYNHELIKTQAKLEDQLLMIDDELKKAKKECYHVAAIIGESEGFTYKQCLLCGVKILKNNTHDYTFNALSYKEEYGKGETSELREKRYDDLHQLVVDILSENEDIDEYGLLLELEERITQKPKIKIK